MKAPKKLRYEAVPELDTPRYLPGDVAVATDVSPSTLKAWLTRDPRVVPLGPYDPAGRGRGTPRLLTLRRVYAIAMTSELVSLGFMASQAGLVGFGFTDLNSEHGGRMVETKGPLFLGTNPAHEFFAWFTHRKVNLDDLLKDPPVVNEKPGPVVSLAVVDCAALMERVRARLKKRGA
jgi:hypothetical protein